MRLKNQRLMCIEPLCQRCRLLMLIVMHRIVIKLHTRLHHHCNHPSPCICQSMRRKNIAMYHKRLFRILNGGHLQRIHLFVCTARGRHFSSHDVEQLVRLRRSRFCYRTQPSRPFCHNLRRGHSGIAGARHARIQMQLGKAFRRVPGNHLLGQLHRFLGRLCAPRIRPQVIAA